MAKISPRIYVYSRPYTCSKTVHLNYSLIHSYSTPKLLPYREYLREPIKPSLNTLGKYTYLVSLRNFPEDLNQQYEA